MLEGALSLFITFITLGGLVGDGKVALIGVGCSKQSEGKLFMHITGQTRLYTYKKMHINLVHKKSNFTSFVISASTSKL